MCPQENEVELSEEQIDDVIYSVKLKKTTKYLAMEVRMVVLRFVLLTAAAVASVC